MTMRNWFDERRISPMDGRARESRFIAVRSSQDTLVPDEGDREDRARKKPMEALP